MISATRSPVEGVLALVEVFDLVASSSSELSLAKSTGSSSRPLSAIGHWYYATFGSMRAAIREERPSASDCFIAEHVVAKTERLHMRKIFQKYLI